jgi:hypothetical protein
MTTGTRVLAALAIISATWISHAIAQQPVRRSIFLASDDHQKEWCAFTDEASWKSKVELSDAAIVATLNYSNSRLDSIDVTTEDEAGDWTVFDHYTLSQRGVLERLERKANILPGRRSVLETYALADGKIKLSSRETKPLTAGQKPISETWLPDVRVAARLGDFQFASLARMKYSEIQSKGTVCVAARPGAP